MPESMFPVHPDREIRKNSFFAVYTNYGNMGTYGIMWKLCGRFLRLVTYADLTFADQTFADGH